MGTFAHPAALAALAVAIAIAVTVVVTAIVIAIAIGLVVVVVAILEGCPGILVGCCPVARSRLCECPPGRVRRDLAEGLPCDAADINTM